MEREGLTHARTWGRVGLGHLGKEVMVHLNYFKYYLQAPPQRLTGSFVSLSLIKQKTLASFLLLLMPMYLAITPGKEMSSLPSAGTL